MSHKKVYSYDDVYLLFKEHAEIINNKFKELNKNIIYPTEKEYEQFIKDILEKTIDKERCAGMYLRGKNKNQRCQAPPHPGLKYCLRHRSQDPNDKYGNQNPEIKDIYETDPQILREAIELFKKSKLNQDDET
jgi:hypothetical protein